eukprot:gb/GECH01014552.1/.p1 GENE.gb/GECH01014552.1/~~gb/GECH01014552.1/.p1  ORF type:complete len:121 (+),score=36.90 gb/GECH01014552.1/:1-363(+)
MAQGLGKLPKKGSQKKKTKKPSKNNTTRKGMSSKLSKNQKLRNKQKEQKEISKRIIKRFEDQLYDKVGDMEHLRILKPNKSSVSQHTETIKRGSKEKRITVNHLRKKGLKVLDKKNNKKK